jgi:ankyrin repeat protein
MNQACRVGDVSFADAYLCTRPLTDTHRELACMKGNVQLIQLFYYLGYAVDCCLTVACTLEYTDIIDFILSISTMTPETMSSETLDALIITGNTYSINAFIAKNIRFNDNCIYRAATMGDISLINKLYTLGYDLNYIDHRGRNALFAAVIAQELETARFLIDMDVDVEHINKEGQTCLHAACSNDDRAMVQLLLDYGCPSINDRFGDRPQDLTTDKSIMQLFGNTT